MTKEGSSAIVDFGGVRVRSVSRYPAGDFGRDVLADHHATSHH
jgi:hypothetical protein